jgi:hypothetical protein
MDAECAAVVVALVVLFIAGLVCSLVTKGSR